MTYKLQELLAEAWEKKPGAARSFFEVLLESELFIPLSPASIPKSPSGDKNLDVESFSRFLTVEFEGHRTLPVFSEEQFVFNWAGEEIPTEKKSFKVIARLLSPETWLHIDANQQFGRELSPWEIEQLKLGPEAIAAVLQEGQESGEEELQVDSKPEGFEKFKERISIAAEAYSWVNELKVLIDEQASVKEEIKERFKQEIKSLLEEYQYENAIVVEESGASLDPHSSLIRDYNPFYIRQRSIT